MNILFTLLLLFAAPAFAADEFRFFILRDPISLHPLKSSAGATSHVLNNLYRGFYRYDDAKDLISELVTCRWPDALHLRCRLKNNLKYANGEAVTADDFVRTLTTAQTPDVQPAITAELLQVKTVEKLSETEFQLTLSAPDRDLMYRLASPVFTPLPAKVTDDQILARDYATGPYRLKKWERGRYLLLEPNPNYHDGAPELNLKAYIIHDETTALKMYQTGQLDFLRRIPWEHYEEIKNLPGFRLRPLLRMDYLGFGDALANEPKIREALGYALDYREFQKIFHSPGRPGCYGIPESLSGPAVCYDFDPQKARDLIKDIDPAKLAKLRLKLYVSEQAGEHGTRPAQWYQAQWKKHLGLNVEIEVMEQNLLTETLRSSPPAIFRRGVPVERPTCLAALEPFTPGNPDNFLQIDRPKVVQNVKQLREKPLTAARKRSLCREALSDLLRTHKFIPLGQMHFMTVTNKTFTGVELNALYQLNLAKLRKLKPDQSPSEK